MRYLALIGAHEPSNVRAMAHLLLRYNDGRRFSCFFPQPISYRIKMPPTIMFTNRPGRNLCQWGRDADTLNFWHRSDGLCAHERFTDSGSLSEKEHGIHKAIRNYY